MDLMKKERYITSGIDANIPLEIQLFLWGCLEATHKQGLELDYLQVFLLEKVAEPQGGHNQKIVHTQEVPERSEAYLLSVNEAVDAKIFVIDDGDHITMLLAKEY